jgi:environmental stress-induced protein Ves
VTLIRRIRRAQYNAMPWRNGQGMTLEIAREPPAPAAFEWRLSLATVSQSVPYSPLPQYQRCISLIDGNGMRLDFPGLPSQELTAVGDIAHFAGDYAPTCVLLNGPSRDLSLMVREPGSITSVTTLRCEREQYLPSDPGSIQALFCLEGDAVLTQHKESVEFASHDTVLSPCNEVSSIRPVRPTATVLLRLVWRVG